MNSGLTDFIYFGIPLKSQFWVGEQIWHFWKGRGGVLSCTSCVQGCFIKILKMKWLRWVTTAVPKKLWFFNLLGGGGWCPYSYATNIKGCWNIVATWLRQTYTIMIKGSNNYWGASFPLPVVVLLNLLYLGWDSF